MKLPIFAVSDRSRKSTLYTWSFLAFFCGAGRDRHNYHRSTDGTHKYTPFNFTIRSLQSKVSTIQTVVLTADVFQLFTKKKKNFDVEDTCRTYYRTFVHIQSIGRYDSIGATCHRESDKKCTVGDFVSSIVLGHLSRAEAESHRLSSAPRPLISSTLFLLVTDH